MSGKKISNKNKAIAAGVAGLIVLGVVRNISGDKRLRPSFWRNVQRTDNPKYYLTSNQTFRGDDYEDCPGAMVDWQLNRIYSPALSKMDVSTGDVIRVYRHLEDGTAIIDKTVIIINTGNNFFEVNRFLWGGHENEENPSLRKKTELDSPQTMEDGRIYHVRVKHIGYVIDWDEVEIVGYDT